MAAGIPVVSTGQGAEGLQAQPGVHYLKAETSEEMAANITELSANRTLAESLAEAGRELVRQR